MLAEYASFFGDPKLLDEDIKLYQAVTTDDVQRVARNIFNKEGATIVDVFPQEQKNEKAMAN